MPRTVSQPFILILLLASGMAGIAGEAQGPDTTIADLSWISGSWEVVDGDGVERARELAAQPGWTRRERDDFLEEIASLAGQL